MIGTILQANLAPFTIIVARDNPQGQPSPSLFTILTANLVAGLDPNVYVYFEDGGGNVAVNVRQAVKTVSRNAQYFTVETWS